MYVDNTRINIRKYLHLFWLELTRPYPFQLWIAPRKKKWCFAESELGPKRKSPPGFSFSKNDESSEQTEYAMYLYPDGISMYWWIYFLSSVWLHAILDICMISKCTEISPFKYAFGMLLFAISYYLIYTHKRKPVLDDLWPLWPDTKSQREYFKNICSRINFASRDDFYKHVDMYDIFSFNKYKNVSYFNRPIFFNPRGSIQEGLLRAAIADFFAVEKRKDFVKNIFIYYFSHVWISFLYLSVNLLFTFRWHPYKNEIKRRKGAF